MLKACPELWSVVKWKAEVGQEWPRAVREGPRAPGCGCPASNDFRRPPWIVQMARLQIHPSLAVGIPGSNGLPLSHGCSSWAALVSDNLASRLILKFAYRIRRRRVGTVLSGHTCSES